MPFGVHFDYAVEGYVEGVGGFLPGNLPAVGLENTGSSEALAGVAGFAGLLGSSLSHFCRLLADEWGSQLRSLDLLVILW